VKTIGVFEIYDFDRGDTRGNQIINIMQMDLVASTVQLLPLSVLLHPDSFGKYPVHGAVTVFTGF
jgi:hypothetical protein